MLTDAGADGAPPTITCTLARRVGCSVEVAVIVAVPAETAVTRPVVALTVATAGRSEAYVTVWAVRPVKTPDTVAVWPTLSWMVADGVIEIVGTTGAGGWTFSSHAAKARVVANTAKILNADVRALIWSPPG